MPTTLTRAYEIAHERTGSDEWLDPEHNPLSYLEFHGSEGGRKCVCCHRYRRRDDLLVVGSPDCGHTQIGNGTRLSITVQPVCRWCAEEE